MKRTKEQLHAEAAYAKAVQDHEDCKACEGTGRKCKECPIYTGGE